VLYNFFLWIYVVKETVYHWDVEGVNDFCRFAGG
jgi:hypothetical protein